MTQKELAQYRTSKANTLGHEGGFANVKGDRGGRTWRGVAEKIWGKEYPDIFRILDEAGRKFAGDLKKMQAWLYAHELLEDLVDEFYHKEFWDKQEIGLMPWQSIADKLFDAAVNCGPQEIGFILQRCLNMANRNELDWGDIKEDGWIGPVTRRNLATLIDKRSLRKTEILIAMEHFQTYRAIVRNDPSQEKFFWGWFNRLLTFVSGFNMKEAA